MQIISGDKLVELEEYTNKQNIQRHSENEVKDTQALVRESEESEKKQEEQDNSPKERILEELKKETVEIENTRTELKFGIHEGTNQITVKVINSETSEVIKEIPSEKILDMIGKLFELSGIFIDEKR